MSRGPEPLRMAIHQAGHAVAQALIGSGRFAVSRVTLGIEPNAAWPDHTAWGEAALDREIRLSVYEFGLVTLAGIAAEERYLASHPPEEEPLVALSDLAEWNEQAKQVFDHAGKVELVSLNIMRKLREWFTDPAIWQVVEDLAAELVTQGTLAGSNLASILERLPR